MKPARYMRSLPQLLRSRSAEFWPVLRSLAAEELERLAGAMVNTELHTKRLMDQLRFLHTVLADVHDLADEESKTPLQNMGLIRIKTQVALRAAAQSGLL